MYLKNSKKIVIKIGSSLLVDQEKKVRKKWLSSFAKDIKKLRSNNQKIIIVSSGAIALGCKKMNYNKRNLKLDKSQAIASIGQIELMNLFLETFSKYKLDISQILLTLDDTEERRRSINAKRTFENLFDLDFIPIVNENDTIATSEIKYGDNDRLASRVAQITNADTLILLSDVDGLYTKNPKKFKDAQLIKKVIDLDKVIKSIASQLFEVCIHRVKREFESVHSENNFNLLKNSESGIEMSVSGKNQGDKYRVKNNCINMVYRKIHGTIIEIFVEEFLDTGTGSLSKKYSSQQIDPDTLETNSQKLEYEDEFLNMGKDDYWILNSRTIKYLNQNQEEEMQKFVFEDLCLLN